MGLITMPFRGMLRIFEEVAERAEAELYDEDAIKGQLTELYMKLESGALSEEEFALREAELVEHLEAIEAHKRRKAGRGRR